MQTTVLRDKSDGRVTCFRKLHIKECGLSHRNPKRFVALEVSLTEFQLQAFKRKDLSILYLRSHIILHVHWSTLQAATSYIVAIKIKKIPPKIELGLYMKLII